MSTSNTVKCNTTLGEALRLARQGIPVFPCLPGRKDPAIKGGHNQATADKGQIRRWFSNGDYNLGIPTGQVSGIIVLDEDCYKPGAEDSLSQLEAENGPLPETRTIKTRAGGRQYYFRAPAVATKNSSGALAVGIDTRGDGGYVVAPPSWVDADEKGPAGFYSVEKDRPLAELPKAWIEVMRDPNAWAKGRPSASRAKPELRLVASNPFMAGISPGFVLPERIPDGERNDTLWRYRGHLEGRGTPADLVEHAVRDANRARCEPPLDDDDLEKILRREGAAVEALASSDEWPEPIPVEYALPDVPAFDYAMVPDCVRGYVKDGAERMDIPPEFSAAPLIVGMSAALGNRVLMAPKKTDIGWLVTPNLWGAIVGRPGVLKSPAIDYAVAPLKRLEAQLEQSNQQRRQQYIIDKAQHDAAMKSFKANISKGAAPPPIPVEPEKPRDERLIINDTTVAKLGDIAVGSPRGLCVIRDELTGLLFQLGAEGHEGDREFYLTAWNGNTEYRIDRMERGSLLVPNLTISMMGGIQPGKLDAYVRATTRGGKGDDGLLQRFQIIVYPDNKSTWKNVDRAPDLQASDDAQSAFERLWKVDPTAIGAQSNFERSKYWLHFTDEAQSVFDQWRERFETGLRKGERHPALESHFAKYRSLIPSLALIFHLADGGTGPVTVGPLVMALQLGGYLKRHAMRGYAGALSSAEIAAQTLSAQIAKGALKETFSVRDVQRKGWAGLAEREDAEAAVDILIEHHWLRDVPQELITGRGRRPARLLRTNPKLGRSNFGGFVSAA